MPTDAEIDAALDAVIAAARNHRAVLRTSVATDDEVWTAYVALNNASVHYDDVLNRAYDEVTPWDCEYIEDDDADDNRSSKPLRDDRAVAANRLAVPTESVEVISIDHHGGNGEWKPSGAAVGPLMVCIRHRRDYTVEDVPALLAAAEAASGGVGQTGARPVTHVGQALYLLMEAGDGTIGALDERDELEPGNGVMLINEIAEPVPLAVLDVNPELGFRMGEQERLLYRLDEVMTADESVDEVHGH